jgi:hypothetical protein
MERSTIIYKEKEYPTFTFNAHLVFEEVPEHDCFGVPTQYTVAEAELWDAIKDDWVNKDTTAINVDESIYFYCENGIISDGHSDEEIIEYLKQNAD